MFAVLRLVRAALEAQPAALSTQGGHDVVALILLLLLIPAMVYLEAYRGFYLAFAPRVVARSKALSQQKLLTYHILAPLFCFGFIGSTARRKTISFLLSFAILALVFGVRALPIELRWAIDFSVALALFLGAGSILYLAYQDWEGDGYQCDPEVPSFNSSQAK